MYSKYNSYSNVNEILYFKYIVSLYQNTPFEL